MSKEITKEEVRTNFISHMKLMVEYWDKEEDSKRDALEGLLHSMFVTFDGCSGGFPCAIDMVLRPHKEDKQYRIDNDEDWVKDGTILNDDVQLKSMIWKDGKW